MDKYPAWKRSEIMARIRSTDTRAEVRLRKALFAKGLRYRLHVRGLPGTPDIVLPKYRCAIQVRGCFWHAHEGCRRASRPSSNTSYWLPKLARNTQRDAAADAELRKLGWLVFVVWECEVASASGLKTVSDRIARKLAKAQLGR